MNLDLFYTFALLSIMLVTALAYSVRVLFQGRPQYDRVERQGASAL